MTPPDVDAGMVRRDQRDRDADVIALAQDVVGIEQTEGEADERRLAVRA